MAQRIEVLRGPATLLYGSSAIGGVVNVTDRRLPRAIHPAPLGAVGDVARHIQMAEQPHILEHHPDTALVRGARAPILARAGDLGGSRALQP